MLSGCGVKDLKVDRPVAMDDPVAQTHRLLPRKIRKPILHLVTDARGRLPEHGEVPQQSVSTLPIACEVCQVKSAARDCACVAASSISAIRRMSRCIQQPCFSQHLLAQALV